MEMSRFLLAVVAVLLSGVKGSVDASREEMLAKLGMRTHRRKADGAVGLQLPDGSAITPELVQKAQKKLKKRGAAVQAASQAVVLDAGSGYVKAGLAGDDAPSVVFPSIVGRPRHAGVMVGIAQKDVYVGNEAQAKRGILSLKYPVERGIVTDWDNWEELVKHTLANELEVDPAQHNVLVTDAPLNPKANREKTMQEMFETQNAQGVYVATQAVLALLSTGRTTGVVVDSGDSVTYVVPIKEGFVLPEAVQRLDFGGRDVTSYLQVLLTERGYSFTTTAEKEIVRDIKEKLGTVKLDYDSAMQASEETTTYELPDGQVITIGKELFRAPEATFRPSLIGNTGSGVAQMTFDAVQACDEATRPAMYANVVVVGGNTLFSGFEERLLNDMQVLATGSSVKVEAPAGRQYAAWKGGSILASLSTSDGMWTTSQAYQASGPTLVHQQCF